MSNYVKGILKNTVFYFCIPLAFIGAVVFYFFLEDGGKNKETMAMTLTMMRIPVAAAFLIPIAFILFYLSRLNKLKGTGMAGSLKEEVNSCRDVVGGCQFLFDEYFISFERLERVPYHEIESINCYTVKVRKSYTPHHYIDVKLKDGRVVQLRKFASAWIDVGRADERKGFHLFRELLTAKAPHVKVTRDAPLITSRRVWF